MKSLFWKEIRQARSLLIFSAALPLLLVVIGAFAMLAHGVAHDLPEVVGAVAAAILQVVPLVVGLFAGASLFAAEADHGTVPLLFSLPLSRRRIWLAKALAGLAITFVSTAIALAVGRLAVGATEYLRPVAVSVPATAALTLFVFAVAAFVSSVTSYAIGAVIGALFLGGALVTGLVWLLIGYGIRLLSYEPLRDLALWCLFVTPALFLASEIAIRRGELFQSPRRLAYAFPALVAGLAATVLLVCGVARVATRYARSQVRSISPPFSFSYFAPLPNRSLLAVTTGGDPVPAGGFASWLESIGFLVSANAESPAGASVTYRREYSVLVDLHTGRKRLVLRGGSAFTPSPDGRFAAVVVGPQGLTWGPPGFLQHAPPQLQVFDLRRGRRISSTVLGSASEPASEETTLQWSPRGDCLIFSFRLSNGYLSAPRIMRPDGSGLRKLVLPPGSPAYTGSFSRWSPTEDVIYVPAPKGLYQVFPEGQRPRLLLPAGASSSGTPFVSPDGKWIAVPSGRDFNPAEDTELVTATIRLVNPATGESQVLGSWEPIPQPVPPPVNVPGRPPAQPSKVKFYGRTDLRLVWTSDNSALYALVWVEMSKCRLYRWRPGEAGFSPVGPELPYPKAGYRYPDRQYSGAILTAQPASDAILIWPDPGWPYRQRGEGWEVEWEKHANFGLVLVDSRGTFRPVPDAKTAVTFAKDHRFICFDAAGRLITLYVGAPFDTIRATDLTTGRSEQIYP